MVNTALDTRSPIGPYAFAAGWRAGESGLRVAVIGSGVCGVAAAKTLKRLGHEVTITERGGKPGGVWAVAYAGAARCRATASSTPTATFPGRRRPARSPPPLRSAPMSKRQSRISASMSAMGMKSPISHRHRRAGGWGSIRRHPGHRRCRSRGRGRRSLHAREGSIALEGRERFKGRILTEHEMADPAMLDGKRVAIVGMGKTAVDMASFALGHARQIHHIFREARWMLPRHLIGQDTTRLAAERMSSYFNKSWVYPHRLQRLTQRYNPSASAINDAIATGIITSHARLPRPPPRRRGEGSISPRSIRAIR